MERRTTNSVDARRAAAYLSKYCTECVGCIECIFDIGNEGQSCIINSGCAPPSVGNFPLSGLHRTSRLQKL